MVGIEGYMKTKGRWKELKDRVREVNLTSARERNRGREGFEGRGCLR